MRFAILALILATVSLHAAAGHFPDVTFDEMKTIAAAKSAVIIDVNGSDSFKAGHVPGAIDYEANSANLAKLLPADKGALIIAYCGGPACGAYAKAANAAAALGYTNVKHFKDGLSGWTSGGGTIEK